MKRVKIFSLFLALVLMLQLVGCGDTGQDSNTEQNTRTTITVTDHEGNVVEVPQNVERIVVCDIYPLPSVLAVFFDSAEKIVGMAKPSMTAAQNSLLSELYPEILQAQTDFIDGTNVNIEELLK